MATRGVDENGAALDELPEPFLIVVGPEDACLQRLLYVGATDCVGTGLPSRITRFTHQICEQPKLARELLLIADGAHAVLQNSFDAAAVKVAESLLTTQ